MNDSYPQKFDTLRLWGQDHSISDQEVLERFAQGEVLRSIAESRELSALLVFKGGNALDFVWLPNRSTKDLDFSVLDASGLAEVSESRLQALLVAALTDPEALSEVVFKIQRVHRNPPELTRPFATFQINVGYALPDEPTLVSRMARGLASPHVVKVEVTINEVVCAAVTTDIGNGHRMRVSTIEDIVAEKLRALLQQPLRNRQRPQDLLDIASIMASDLTVDRQLVGDFLTRKAVARAVPVSRSAFRLPDLIERTRSDYEALTTTARSRFIPFDEALAALFELVDSLDIPS
ncbi:MAG: nucleotidyl transferase AbiEii/AbiGii toxin family protein [Dehalococcoidia bacterium]